MLHHCHWGTSSSDWGHKCFHKYCQIFKSSLCKTREYGSARRSQNYLFSREGFSSNVWGVVSNAGEHFIPTATQVQSVQGFFLPSRVFSCLSPADTMQTVTVNNRSFQLFFSNCNRIKFGPRPQPVFLLVRSHPGYEFAVLSESQPVGCVFSGP